MRHFLLLLLTIFSLSVQAQNEWKSVDDSTLKIDQRLKRSDYEVKISREGQEFESLKVYGALVSNIERRDENALDITGATRTLMGFAMFTDSFSKPVKVRIKRQGAPFSKVEVRPSAYNIHPKRIDEQTIEFTLKSPMQKVSVEFDEDRNHNLFLIPDLVDNKHPSVSESNVIYYGAGEHEAGEIVLNSGQRLYLDEGAVVYGNIVAKDAHNIAIEGRGILCGSRNDHNLPSRKVLARFENCTDIRIEGIMMRSSPVWTVAAYGCKGLYIDNMKHICWMRNSDGIDICSTSNVSIRNCFMRNYDDNISLKVVKWLGANVENITVEDCVFWADCAHNLLVGPESKEGYMMRKIRFSRCTLLEGRETADPWRGMMAIMVSDEGAFENVTFEDITIDKARGGMPFSVDFCQYETIGKKAKDITLRRIDCWGEEPMPQSVIRGLDKEHKVENISLHKIKINGKKINNRNLEQYVITNEFIEDLKVR